MAASLTTRRSQGGVRRAGWEDRELALVLDNLGLLCASTNRHTEAISYLERALAIWEKALGSDNPNAALALSNLAGFHCFQGRHAEAEPLFLRALAIAENSLGPENPLMAKILAEYVVLLRKTRRKGEARLLERRAQPILASQAHEALGRHTVDVGELLAPRDDRSGKNRPSRE